MLPCAELYLHVSSQSNKRFSSMCCWRTNLWKWEISPKLAFHPFSFPTLFPSTQFPINMIWHSTPNSQPSQQWPSVAYPPCAGDKILKMEMQYSEILEFWYLGALSYNMSIYPFDEHKRCSVKHSAVESFLLLLLPVSTVYVTIMERKRKNPQTNVVDLISSILASMWVSCSRDKINRERRDFLVCKTQI